jgi:hypothetical protein
LLTVIQRLGEEILREVAETLGKISNGVLEDCWAQSVEIIARATVVSGLEGLKEEGKGEKFKVKLVEQSEIVKLGRDEWKS